MCSVIEASFAADTAPGMEEVTLNETVFLLDDDGGDLIARGELGLSLVERFVSVMSHSLTPSVSRTRASFCNGDACDEA